ncbi:MAG: hypothetical protein IIT58_13335, partial [Treponema sp.]|nr:hypothetical protein [Treponema sp.]
MRKILKHFVALAVLALSVFAPCIAAKAVKPVVVDETQPVVIVEFSANKYIDFFTYKGYISNAGKKSGGGLLGMIASGIDKKVMSDSYTSLLTKNLIEELKVEQIVLDSLKMLLSDIFRHAYSVQSPYVDSLADSRIHFVQFP